MNHLDKSRAFKQVYGIAAHAFEQDGKLFDHEGDEIGATEAKVEPVKKAGKAAKLEPDQVDAQLNG